MNLKELGYGDVGLGTLHFLSHRPITHRVPSAASEWLAI